MCVEKCMGEYYQFYQLAQWAVVSYSFAPVPAQCALLCRRAPIFQSVEHNIPE
jgi:hypothetical protein